MSRCFSYPPPGYMLSGASKEALIESIELQKERDKARDKEQRKKEKRREKKEKKKEKKEKKKEKKDEASKDLDDSGTVQGHIGEKLWTDAKGELFHKGSKAEPEQLERSSLTEEHGQPVCLHIPSSSSDSTENSNKRKRQCSPIDVTRGHGKIIRIRLSSKKQNESDASANEKQLCSTSGRTDSPSQDKDDFGLRHRREDFGCALGQTSNIGQGFTLRTTDGEQICCTSQPINGVAPGRTGFPCETNAVTATMQGMGLQYRNLIENWVPPLSQGAPLDPDDLDWLFQRKNGDIRAEIRLLTGNDNMSYSSSSPTLRTRAQYLQEVDVYAMPFAVPF